MGSQLLNSIRDSLNLKRTRNFGWGWLFDRILAKKRIALLLLLSNLMVYGVGLAFPLLTQRAVDAIVYSDQISLSLIYLSFSLGAIVLEYIISIVRQNYLINIGTFIDRELASNFYLSLLTRRTDRPLKKTVNINTVFGQIRPLRSFVLSFIPRILFDAGGAIVALTAMFFLSWPITLAVVVVTAFFAMAISNQIPLMSTASKEQFKIDSQRQQILNETFPTLETVKSLVVEGRLFQRWRRVTARYTEIVGKVFLVSNRFSNASLLSSRAISLTIISVGCVQIGFSTLTLGELLAVQLLAARATAPVFTFGDVIRQWKDAAVAMDAFNNFMSEERERPRISGGIRDVSAPKIAFRNVTFTYPGSETPALANLNFETPETGLIGIVGRNGAGKSTLTKLLLGLRRDFEGSVLVGNAEVRDYHPRVLRDKIRVLQQDTVLFTGTLRENLDVGLAARSEDDMWRALDFAEATKIVAALPDGLDSPITENPRNLSGGQRQRIAVARAFIGDPQMVILDEPTAFLDAEAALRLEQKILCAARDKLLLLVSHNLSALREASMIIVLENGEITGCGRHDDLLASCSEYQKLWQDHIHQK